MTSLTLIRHAATELNEARRFQGHLDAGISDEGRRQAMTLGARGFERMGDSPIDSEERPSTLWTSDLRRAWETAALAFPEAELRPDPRLRELDFGLFDGRTFQENRALHGRGFLDWVRDPMAHDPPGGESLTAFRKRLAGWLDVVSAEPAPVAVTHGGAIHMIQSILTGTTFLQVRRTQLSHCAVLHFEACDRGWVVHGQPALAVEDE